MNSYVLEEERDQKEKEQQGKQQTEQNKKLKGKKGKLMSSSSSFLLFSECSALLNFFFPFPALDCSCQKTTPIRNLVKRMQGARSGICVKT